MRLPTGLVVPLLLFVRPSARHPIAAIAPQAAETYDGAWWQSATLKERSGFVAGVADCYIGDYGGPKRFEDSSLNSYRDRTTVRYQRLGSTHLGEPVLQTLLGFDSVQSTQGLNPVKHRAGHGYFDGLHWMEMTYNGDHAEQYGYLKGYLSCYRHYFPREARVFTHSPIEYQTWITKWYRFDEATGDVDPDRQKVAIADVLRRVARGPE